MTHSPSKKYQLLALVIRMLFLGVLLILLPWQFFLHSRLSLPESSTVFEIAPGESARVISDNLYQRHIVAVPYAFEILIRLSGTEKQLKIGEYQIEATATPLELLDQFVKGQVLQHPFTIVEGWDLNQLKQALMANPYIEPILAKEADWAKALHLPIASMEGLLYPDTYFFVKGTSDKAIVRQAFMSMQKELARLWAERDKDNPLTTPYAALILASLVEKETADPVERPLIAGVFFERLRINMPLQTDPSVIYALGNNYTGHLTHQDLQILSPYNTYKVRGLPPTPIAFPSASSILAVLHPAKTKSLYFFAKGDGTHLFSEDYATHLRAIAAKKANLTTE